MMMGKGGGIQFKNEVEGLISCVKIRESRERKNLFQKA
jgi:hypothetical protein